MKYLNISHLETLPTKRLLNYYKITLKRVRRHQDSLYCPCCGMPNYQTNGKLFTKEENIKRKEEFETDIETSENYLTSIKTILNTRENIER